jgi:hypothetical protein
VRTEAWSTPVAADHPPHGVPELGAASRAVRETPVVVHEPEHLHLDPEQLDLVDRIVLVTSTGTR